MRMRTFILAIIIPLRAMLRSLQTDAARVPALERLVRGVLLLIPMSIVIVALRLYQAAAGTLEIESTTHDGVRMRCRLPDLVQVYLWIFGTWEPDVTAFIRRRLKPGDGFIDIGAHVGTFSILVARLVGEGGRVLAVEASAETMQALMENVECNGSPRCLRTSQVAVSDAPGRLTLYGGPAHNLGLTSTRKHRAMQPIGEVDAAPIEEIASEEELRCARLIKIDVEGGEDRVLRQLATVLDRLRDDVEIVVELSPSWWDDVALLPQDLIQPFIHAGFHAYELPNCYWPWRYLWPNDVEPPRRVRRELTQRVARIDLVLSRVDADAL